MNPEQERSSKPRTTIETLGALSLEDIEQICILEAEAFNSGQWFEELADFRELLEQPASCVVVQRDEAGTIVGFILGVPSSQMVERMKGVDPEYVADESVLYITSIVVTPQYRGGTGVQALTNTLSEVARARGYTTIAAHVPTQHLALYQNKFGARNVRPFAQWDTTDVPHNFVEFPLYTPDAL